MRSTLVILLLFVGLIIGAPLTRDGKQSDGHRTRKGGPIAVNLERKPNRIPHLMLRDMFRTMERVWFPNAYGRAQSVDFRLSVDADLPARALSSRSRSGGSVNFDVDVQGLATPSGNYAMELTGGLGEVDIVKNTRRTMMVGKNFRAFSDTPRRTRSKNAGLTNYRSYLLKYAKAMENQLLDSGVYRSVYKGSTTYMGREVNIITVYKPRGRNFRPNSKRPISMRKMWTFWHDGGYEIWLDQATKLPLVVFYTNTDDNIFANFSIDYTSDRMPIRINFNNNSVGAEGRGDIVLDFDRARMLRGFSFRFNSDKGVSMRADASLLFGAAPPSDSFRILPPFGFRKMNRDHLRLMVLTEVSGGLLKLKQYGINIKNFKF